MGKSNVVFCMKKEQKICSFVLLYELDKLDGLYKLNSAWVVGGWAVDGWD